MKTILLNPKEIESVWEKNNVCFVKTNTGKVWLCKPILSTEYLSVNDIREGNFNNFQTMKTIDYIQVRSKDKSGTFLSLELTEKGKSESNG